MEKVSKSKYLDVLKERRSKTRVSKQYQSTGLTLAEILEDGDHKSLYIKLAKQYDAQTLIGLAKDVALRKQVKNKGAYFMRVLQQYKSKTKNK